MAKEVQQVQEINEHLAELSAQVLPPGISLYYAHVDELREQSVNPRSMPQEMMDQLIENISVTGGLESAPLCVLVDDRIEIISGHHRIRAAREAGIEYVLVFLYEKLSPSRIKAKQLAHNTIQGQDDVELVKRVWDEITDIQARFEAFVDPRIFDDIPDSVSFRQVDVDLYEQSKTVLLAFLPIQEMDFEGVIEQIVPQADFDKAYLANREIYDQWKAALQRVRQEVEIVSIPTAVAEMARLAMEALDQRAEQTEQDVAAKDDDRAD